MTVYDRTRPRPHEQITQILTVCFFRFGNPSLCPYTGKPNKYARRTQVNASISLIERVRMMMKMLCASLSACYMRFYFFVQLSYRLVGGNDFFSFISIIHIATRKHTSTGRLNKLPSGNVAGIECMHSPHIMATFLFFTEHIINNFQYASVFVVFLNLK